MLDKGNVRWIKFRLVKELGEESENGNIHNNDYIWQKIVEINNNNLAFFFRLLYDSLIYSLPVNSKISFRVIQGVYVVDIQCATDQVTHIWPCKLDCHHLQ